MSKLDEKITKWLGNCWHEFPPIPDDDTQPLCLHCKTHAFYLDENYLIGGDTVAGKFNIAYSTDAAACLDLIEAVRAKGHGVAMTADDATAWLVQIYGGGVGSDGFNDKLPMAIALAVEQLAEAPANIVIPPTQPDNTEPTK